MTTDQTDGGSISEIGISPDFARISRLLTGCGATDQHCAPIHPGARL